MTIVFIIDDDQSMREALTRLRHGGSQKADVKDGPGIPEHPSGLTHRAAFTIVIITAYADIPMTVQALKAGVVEFLTKPFRDQQLLDAVQEGIDRDRMMRLQRAEVTELRQGYDSLTQREREVMTLAVTGLLNKQIAAQLGTSEATVKAHRAQVMEKMRAESVAQLVTIAGRLGLVPPPH
jgi:FixJ family two-component response regulator